MKQNEAVSDGTQILTLYCHVAAKNGESKKTRHLQAANAILASGFQEEYHWHTDSAGRERRLEGIDLYGTPSAPEHIIGVNLEVVLTLTEDEVSRFVLPGRTGFIVDGDGKAHRSRRSFIIPAGIINRRAAVRFLPTKEGVKVVAAQWADDAEEYAQTHEE